MMQLTDTPLCIPTPSLEFALRDIANQVQIQPSFCIQHPSYKPFELPSEVVARFQQVPAELQQKYLVLHLRSFLYGIYYNGSMQSALALSSNTEHLSLQQNLENNTILGVDLEFFDRLHCSNQGQGYFDEGWTILRHKLDGTLAAQKGELTLHIQPEHHLASGIVTIVGDVVAVRMPKNLVQNGFYMAVGNTGNERWIQSDKSATVRVYFNYNPEGAISVMKDLTEHLNESHVPFSFKTLYNPVDYHRYDSGVLYFGRQNYGLVRSILESVYSINQTYFRSEIPLFTKFLAPGLGLAEEPNLKFSTQESFGMNRCQMVAQGLIAAQQAGNDSPEGRLHSILQTFADYGISWDRAYLNSDSDDIYLPVDPCSSLI